MRRWYQRHLGLRCGPYGTAFEWRAADAGKRKGFTQWCPFSADTKYFRPSKKDVMINYRVENLDRLIAQLKKEGVKLVGQISVETYGKFVRILDPEGNAIELWEPNDVEYDKIVSAKERTK